MLESKIEKFLTINISSGNANNANSSGCGFDYSYGDSYDYGCGCGFGSGYGDSSGYGDGSDYGYNDNSGSGSGYGSGVKIIQGHTVYMVDDTQTIFTSVRGNVAQGFILQSDFQLKPCYIVKEDNKFAHGSTLRDAFASLQEKLYDDSTEEERIEAFKQKFPSYDTKYDNQDLFAYHHILTGSCRMGREQFAEDKGLSLDDKMSIREFVKLTKDAYGGKTIKQLPQAYGITD